MAIEATCTQHRTALYPMGAIGFKETKAFRSVCASSQYIIYMLKDIEKLAIILVPLIMILSRGHTGQIKG